MKKYNEIKILLVKSLLEKVPRAKSDEIEAIITHWIQSQDIVVPLLTPSMHKHCFAIFQNNRTRPLRLKAVRERGKPYQGKIPISWQGIPFPPVKNPKFTFIDLLSSIGDFE
jgi:hypothetical protein